MKHGLVAGMFVILLALYVMPASIQAYSYGDANTEDVAETFKLVEVSLAGGENGWATAEEAYKVRRSEIASHFGEEVAVTLDNNFKAKDSKLVVSNFKAVLVMNLDRRFKYASDAVEDYASAKLLVAKAKATFDTLAPYTGGNTSEINKAFEDALEALGNPGLFGVGKKAVQPELFKEKINFIYNKVKPLFPYQASANEPESTTTPTVVGRLETSTEITSPSPATDQATPPATVEDPPGVSGAGANSAKPSEAPAAGAPDPGASPEQAAPAAATPSPAVVQAPPPAATEKPPTAEAADTNDAKPTEAPSAAATSPVAPPAATSSPVATSPPAAATKPVDATVGGSSAAKETAHAPMERTDRTNPIVSIAVIAAVLVVMGGGYWLVRKKKWL
jgi:hypothetical protein